MEILGAAALVAGFLLRGSSSPPRRWLAGIGLLALVVAGLLLWTAHRGGQIRHPEIRGEAAAQPPVRAEEAEEERERH